MKDECTDLSKAELLVLLRRRQKKIDCDSKIISLMTEKLKKFRLEIESLETACKGYEKIIAEYRKMDL